MSRNQQVPCKYVVITYINDLSSCVVSDVDRVFKSCCRHGSGLLLHRKKTYTHKAKHLMSDLITFVACILLVIIIHTNIYT